MRSPLEHEPTLVAGIGLITVRWALLEDQLSELLQEFSATPSIGRAMYYSLGSFSQRLNLVAVAAAEGLADGEDRKAAETLVKRIRRLWQARNTLIHSHYIYAAEGTGGYLMQSRIEGDTLSTFRWPKEPFVATFTQVDGEKLSISQEYSGAKFGYEKVKSGSSARAFKPVNESTFNNHAAEISRRVADIRSLKDAIIHKTKLLRPRPLRTVAPPA